MEFPRGLGVDVEYCVRVVMYALNEPKAIFCVTCDQVSNFRHFVCLRKGV
jgi:hypothetical protein